jgi:DNA modification methylase
VRNEVIYGDSLENVKKIDDSSVNCVITSPPYFQLRDYGFPGQWGLEPTYQEYLEHLWELMDEIWRVLREDGTVWVNLGDSYSGSCGMGSQYDKKHAKGMQIIKQFDKGRALEIPNKSLMLIPHRFAIGCIDRGWIVRNDIIWAKRNGMPESVTDRFSKKHEYFFFMVKNKKYYFDLDGVRDLHKSNSKEIARQKRGLEATGYAKELRMDGYSGGVGYSSNGKNPGDVSDFWDIPTKPSSAKHYATFNTDLIDKPIVAGCPEGGIILDPFCGTGTTLVRALQLNREIIGIDGSKEYCKIAEKRINEEINELKLAI